LLANNTPLDGAWEGFQITSFKKSHHNNGAFLTIFLEPVVGVPHCSICGEATPKVHDKRIRVVRDLPILDACVRLWVSVRRIKCNNCGVTQERISWLAPSQQVTRRLAASVAALCEVTTVRATAKHYHLGWDQVKNIDKSELEARLEPIDLSGIEFLLMDEFAIQKGHRYATVVFEPTRRRVLWIGRGRGRNDILPFFSLLGPDRCAKIKAVGMDMTAAYFLEVQRHCPQAQIVYDLFHVVARYGHEVVDRIRVDEANRVAEDRPSRRLVKGARWLLLRNRDNLKQDEQVRLDELLTENKNLMIAYVLKDDLKRLWSFTEPLEARLFWMEWRTRALESKLPSLIRFTENLNEKIDFIISHSLYPLGTNILEGVNNRIKVIKRMAYGFRDDRYFFLKIRSAFP
jgi:transposase